MNRTMFPESRDLDGKEAFARGQYLSAAVAFSEAAAGYLSSGDELMAAEMRSNQCVALLRAKQMEQALSAISGVSKVFESAGDFRRQGMALGNKAAVLSAVKRKDEAIVCYEQAASVLEQAGEDEARLLVMRQAAALYAVRFKLIDALLAVRDGYLGLKKPSWKQRIVKALLFISR